MGKNRLEAFSDGVIAIIITIMVLEMKAPEETNLIALKPLLHVFVSYLLSFIYIGIYWNNHHHLLQATQKVNGKILWANLHLLFWLSLIPFFTSWIGQNSFSPWPVAMYGVDLLFAGIAYFILARILISYHGKNSTLAKAVGTDIKGLSSILIYLIAIFLSFYNALLAYFLYTFVAVMWLRPDQRIENILSQ